MHCYIINEEKDAYKGKEQGSKMDYKKAGVDIEAGYKSVELMINGGKYGGKRMQQNVIWKPFCVFAH